MNEINTLDENEFSDYRELNKGQGQQIKSAMTNYISGLKNARREGFGRRDTSTAHEVINELIVQMSSVSEVMDEVDLMIDNLVHIIQADILDREEELANQLREAE